MSFNPTGSGSPSSVSDPEIDELVITAANIEYSYALPATTKLVRLYSRNYGRVKLYFTTGSTKYTTIEPGCKWESPNLTKGKTLYVKSSVSDVLELEIWK